MAEPPDRRPLRPLLESLMSDHLDPGYAAAAARRSQHPQNIPPASKRWRVIGFLVAGFLIAGLVIGIAARRTEDNAAEAHQVRSGLQADIQRAQDQQARLVASASSLADLLRASQAALGAAGPLATVSNLELQSGLTPVTGPGMSVVIDGATSGSGAGVILDKDIQLLVNGLWSAGAEAVAVDGVRLRITSAIRQAGNAILVDNRPVFWPITIQAVGDKSKLHVNLLDSAGFGRFLSFVSLYDIRFDVTVTDSMSLPGAGRVDLRYASPAPATTAPTASPTTTAPTASPATASPPRLPTPTR